MLKQLLIDRLVPADPDLKSSLVFYLKSPDKQIPFGIVIWDDESKLNHFRATFAGQIVLNVPLPALQRMNLVDFNEVVIFPLTPPSGRASLHHC